MSGISYTGACLCGTVKYTLRGSTEDISGVTACHCEQCRRWAGHHWASVQGPLSGFEITEGTASLQWYKSSAMARRGFCNICGSSLFWHAENYPPLADQIGVSAGSLDNPEGFTLAQHIFCQFKGQYYEIRDGVKIYDTFPGA